MTESSGRKVKAKTQTTAGRSSAYLKAPPLSSRRTRTAVAIFPPAVRGGPRLSPRAVVARSGEGGLVQRLLLLAAVAVGDFLPRRRCGVERRLRLHLSAEDRRDIDVELVPVFCRAR